MASRWPVDAHTECSPVSALPGGAITTMKVIDMKEASEAADEAFGTKRARQGRKEEP